MAAIRITDGEEQNKAHAPAASLTLAYAAMVPTAIGAVAVLAGPNASRRAIQHATILWAGGILCFLAGVRRGLSFRQPGGTTLGEATTMLTVFSLGAGGLLLPKRRLAPLSLLAGYGAIAAADVVAGRTGEAPPYFSRLRPWQMSVPLLSLGAMLMRRRG